MWLLTTIGFFSVVAAQDDPERLVVRSRVRSDLEALRERYLPDIEIVEGAGTDYRYRSFVAKTDFEPAAARLVADIDYTNFKNAVAERQGHARAGVYSKVWSVLYELQRDGA
jgi:hypothetical protein